MTRRILYILSILMLPVLTYGQDGIVVDAQTNQPLPYVMFYVSPSCGTLSNNDGEFHLVCDDDDEVRISCMGYNTLRYKSSEMPSKIHMQPKVTTMKEVTITTADNVLYRLVRKMQKEAKKNQKATGQYFFRLTTQYPGTDELAEAFLTAKSCVQMRDIIFHSGRRGQLKYEETKEADLQGLGRTNLHYFLRLAPVLVNFNVWGHTFVPADVVLSRTKNIYDVTCTSYTEEDGTEICKIMVRSNPNIKSYLTLDGTLYVDRKKLQLLRFEGCLRNLYLRAYDQAHRRTITTMIEYTMHADYRHDHGFTEIASMSGSLVKDSVKLRHILFNLGDKKLPFNKSVRVGSNMLESIDQVGCDSTLWQLADIVKRTRAEERVAFGMETEETIQRKQEEEEPKDTILDNAMRKLLEGTMKLQRTSIPERNTDIGVKEHIRSLPHIITVK